MVTEPDAAVEPATPAAGMSYGARLALTVLLLGLYVLGHRVPLPFVDTKSFAESQLPGIANIMSLGINPLFLGFLVVEAVAAMSSSGRRLRADRFSGRAKLNRMALVVSLVISAIQALGISFALSTMTSPGGMPLVTFPGAVFSLLLAATLTAVTAALFFVGNFLSEYGIGNGFSLLLLTNIVWGLLVAWEPWFAGNAGALDASDPMQGVGFLVAGILAALLIRHVQKSEATRTPPFPQGLVPVIWAGSLLSTSWFLPRLFENLSELPWFTGALVILVAVPFFSWFTFHLFSSRQRLEANVSEPEEVLDGLMETLHRRLLVSTAILTVGTAALTGWSWARPNTFMAFLGFIEMVLIAAIAFDLRDQFLFLRRNGATALLIQLDNVHFSYRLTALLEEEGIDVLARAHHHRALLYFFGPLIKIDMLVPRDRLDEAQAILGELELAREIKVF